MFEQKIDLFNLFITGNKRKIKVNDIPNLIYNLLKFLFFDLQKALNNKSDLSVPEFEGRKIAYVDTINNYESLKFLAKKYNVLFVTSARTPVNDNIFGINKFFNREINFKKYLFLFYLLVHRNYGIKNHKSILLNYNRTEDYYALFKNNKPELIFISNDHEPKSRGLIQASEMLKIPIYYFQHASISKLFPPLNFKASFLYGDYSKSIYKSNKFSKGKIHLVGNHKFDSFKKEILDKGNIDQIKRVGVAYNELDDSIKVLDLIRFLSNEFQFDRIVVRPHPRDSRVILSEDSQNGKIKYSNSKIENSIEFLLGIDFLIAGNSSILLEAALANVVPVQYPLGKYGLHLNDYYGFISTGIAHYLNDLNELKSFLNKEVISDLTPRKMAQIYDASVGSDFEFTVENHIINILEKEYFVI